MGVFCSIMYRPFIDIQGKKHGSGFSIFNSFHYFKLSGLNYINYIYLTVYPALSFCDKSQLTIIGTVLITKISICPTKISIIHDNRNVYDYLFMSTSQ